MQDPVTAIGSQLCSLCLSVDHYMFQAIHDTSHWLPIADYILYSLQSHGKVCTYLVFIRDSLHWLLIHFQFKICFLMRNCVTGSTSHNVNACCIPAPSLPSLSSLQHHLVAPQTWTFIAQSRTFLLWSNWNNLPQSLRDVSPISFDQFHKHLKTSLFVSEDTGPGWECL